MAFLARFQNWTLAVDPGARRIRVMIREMARVLPPALRVLDLGGGRAPYKHFFPSRQYITADLFDRAHARCAAGVLPFSNAAFDVVLCTEVLEHVPNPDATLQEIRRVLRGGGTLVLTTPLTRGVHAVQDYHRWTRMGLVQLLGTYGFCVRDVRLRGGLFLALGAPLLVIPWQVLGEARERRLWQAALFACA
jgi:SAM-dependent methyltransferase